MMSQASLLDGLALDLFAFGEDDLAAAEVDIGRNEIINALVIATVIIVFDEGCDLPFEITWQIVVFQRDAILEGLVPALDLAERLAIVERWSRAHRGGSPHRACP